MTETKIKIKELQAKVNTFNEEILKLAGHKPAMIKWFSVVGTWDCSKSPCGLCCYDHYRDPIHDQCIYCGQPEERK